VAGLEAVRPLGVDVDELTAKGRQALDELLPRESVTSGQERDADAATMFLVEPLGVVKAEVARQIVQTIQQNLEGKIGVKRYVGDSYWAPDYRDHFKLGDRAADFTKRMPERDAWLLPGMEAQWSLIDPLLAVYFAKLGDHQAAWRYLKRSLAQIVDDNGVWKLPEAYLNEHGAWVPNDHLGLLWAEANLLYALTVFDELNLAASSE
jgi:phosphorylase kinase alpha/beta subunit